MQEKSWLTNSCRISLHTIGIKHLVDLACLYWTLLFELMHNQCYFICYVCLTNIDHSNHVYWTLTFLPNTMSKKCIEILAWRRKGITNNNPQTRPKSKSLSLHIIILRSIHLSTINQVKPWAVPSKQLKIYLLKIRLFPYASGIIKLVNANFRQSDIFISSADWLHGKE